jgi:hypothetical protein
VTPFLRRWFDEAKALGLPGWQMFALIVLAALAKILVQSGGVLAWDLIRRIHIDVEPSPPPVSDGGSIEDEIRRTDAPAQPEVTDKIADLTRGGDAG